MTGLPAEAFERIGGGAPAASLPTSTLANPQPWFTAWATGGNADGQPLVVNEFTALNYAALYTAVSLIASTIASLPCKLFRKRNDGGQDEVSDHPAHGLMQVEYNPNTSSMTGRETEVGHLLTWGNSFAQIVRSRSGELLELRPIGPDVVCIENDARNGLLYKVRAYDRAREQRDEVTLDRNEVLHTPHFSFDALAGMSLVRMAKSTIRGGMAADRQAERFVTKGLRAPGAVKLPPGKKFKDEADARQYRKKWNAIHSGEENDQNVIILEDGAEWISLGTDPESAQLLESRKFTRGEIAGLYHIPPHLLGDVEKNTSWGTGIEELNIGFVVYCLLPILRKLEQERNRKLFVRGRRGDEGLFVEHVLAGLLRGDTAKQAQAIQVYMNLGLLSVNDGRKLLGWNPIAGGNVRYFPLNMGRVDADTGEDLTPPPPAESAKPTPLPAPTQQQAAKSSDKLAAALRKSIVTALARCLRKEAAEANKAAKRPGEFVGWIDEFYARHAEMVTNELSAPLAAWAAAGLIQLADGEDWPADCAACHVARSRDDLLSAAECRPAELPERVERAVERWQTERVAEVVAELSGGLVHA